MNRRQTTRKSVLGAVVLLGAVLQCEAVQLPTVSESAEDASPGVCVLSGKVVDFDTGRPVPYFHLLHMKTSGALVEHLETDETGHFRATAPKGSERYLQFNRSKRGTYIIDWDQQRQIGARPFRGLVRDDMTDLVFKVKLWPVTMLTGKVVDAAGQPVDNASIYVHGEVPAIKTDATGTFHLEVAPTHRDFEVFAITADMNQAGLVHLKANSTTATIPMEPTASYRGCVVDTQGESVGPFKFLVGLRLNGSSNDCLQQSLQADTDGTFTIDALCPQADYLLWWFPDEQVNMTLGAHGDKRVDLSQHGPGAPIEIVVTQYLNTITARVVDANGAPVEDARTTILTRRLQSSAQNRSGSGVRTDRDGRASLRSLAAGEALVYVYKAGYRPRYIWTPTDTGNLEIVLRPSSEAGLCEVQVVDDDCQPVSDVPVRLDVTVLESGRSLSSRTARTDVNGRAEFAMAAYDADRRAMGALCCDVAGYDLAYNSITAHADAQVKLVLHETGRHWSGRLVDPQQNPIAGAELYLTSMSQRVRTPRRTTAQALNQSFYDDPSLLVARSDSEGRFVLHRFNRQDFARVMVKAPGFSSDELDFSPDAEAGRVLRSQGISTAASYVFELSPDVAILSGVLVGASSGQAVPGTRIVLTSVGGSAREVTTDEKGAFRIEDLESGEYIPCVRDSGDAEETGRVCVPETIVASSGQTLQATIEMRKGVVLKGRVVGSVTQRPPSARRAFLDARLESGHTIASDKIEPDGRWQLLLPPGDYGLYYSEFVEDARRFMGSERPLSMRIEDKAYADLVLGIGDGWALSLQGPSLIGQALPRLDDMGVSLSPSDTDTKVILLCFFDFQQRPSRNCIVQLAKRAQRLKGSGIVIAAVEAGKAERERLAAWGRENDIAFPIGTIESREGQTRLNWGVKSLPWLILTDAQHVIRAEGFALDQLDAKIAEIEVASEAGP